VLIASFPAGPWETNCYVVSTGPGTECVVIDPGYQAADGVAEVIRERRLKPVALLATHGHLDHVFSVTPVCSTYAMPAWIHPDDRHLLSDPLAGLGPGSADLLAQLTGRWEVTMSEPDDVRLLEDGARVEVAGLAFGAVHAPGHTAGSVMFTIPWLVDDTTDQVVFTGDVVFAGAIGRTDLPGGDDAAMRNSLRTRVLALDDRSALLPGHGPQTTMARERAANPYLQSGYLAAGLPGRMTDPTRRAGSAACPT